MSANWYGRKQRESQESVGFARVGNCTPPHLSKEDHEAGKKYCSKAAEDYINNWFRAKWGNGKRGILRDRDIKQPALIHGIFHLCLVALLRVELIVILQVRDFLADGCELNGRSLSSCKRCLESANLCLQRTVSRFQRLTFCLILDN